MSFSPRWTAFLLLAALLIAPGVDGQDSPWSGSAQQRQVAAVPFGPGEMKSYEVRLGRLRVGEGSMEVGALDYVRGHRSYPLTMRIQGGIPLARVNDRMDSWLDIQSLNSHRFVQDLHQIRTRRYRHYEFYPEEGRYTQNGVDEELELASLDPLDDVSFLYYVRTLPLRVGDVYTLDRYFRESGNPVVVEVVRKDRITVPAGTFNTVVVRPTIRTSGLFGEGGEAEIHFSDDDQRLMVMMTSRVPVMGSLSLHLSEYTPGRSLRPFRAGSRAEEAEEYLRETDRGEG